MVDDSTDPAGPNSLDELRLAHWILIGLGLVGLLFILFYSMFGARDGARLTMLAWGTTAALASLSGGLIIGLLFGLPNVRRVEISNGDGASEAGVRNAKLGYSESTNLEQVADWLTKIIIGLTLTQFALWEARFTQLSYDLSCFLTGDCRAVRTVAGTLIYPAGSTVPGGFLMAFYAVLGFLIGYMWMRGYFISEMEGAKAIAARRASADAIKAAWDRVRQAEAAALIATTKAEEDVKKVQDASARELETARQELETAKKDAQTIRDQAAAAKADFDQQLTEARKAGLAQEPLVEGTRDSAEAVARSAVAIADNAAVIAPDGEATIKAQQLRRDVDQLKYPEDPWRDAFGGSAAAAGYTLKGIVRPREDSSDYFDVELMVETDLLAQPDAPGKSVQFFLHPTFGKDAARSVSFNQIGVAPLPPLIAYGAFTVGALVEDGTLLELNLAKVEGVPDRFLSRLVPTATAT